MPLITKTSDTTAFDPNTSNDGVAITIRRYVGRYAVDLKVFDTTGALVAEDCLSTAELTAALTVAERTAMQSMLTKLWNAGKAKLA